MKIKITLLLIFVSIMFANAQQVPIYNLYNNSRFFINPAKTGSDGKLALMTNFRQQWVGMNAAPKTGSFAVHGNPINKMGVGLLVIANKQGIFRTTTALANYSYTTKISDIQSISLGVAAGTRFTYIDVGAINNKALALDDPLLIEDHKKNEFDGGIGLTYNIENFELCISAPRIFSDVQHYFSLASYNYSINSNFSIMPAVSYQILPQSPNQFDGHLLFGFRDLIWLQGTYRDNGNLIFALGLNVKQIELQYSYEYNADPLNNISNNSNEIGIIFRIGKTVEDQAVEYEVGEDE